MSSVTASGVGPEGEGIERAAIEPGVAAQEPAVGPVEKAPATEETPVVEFDTIGPEHLGLESFVTSDYHRPSLGGVHLKGGVAYATDGRIALIVPMVKFPASDLPASLATVVPQEKAVTIPGEALKRVKVLLPKKASSYVMSRPDPVVVGQSSNEGEVVLAASAGEIRAMTVQGEYPHVEKVVESAQGKSVVVISASLLKDLAAYAARYGRKGSDGTPITFYFDPEKPMNPVRFEFPLEDDRTVRGVFAVMRVHTSPRDESEAAVTREREARDGPHAP